MIAPQGGLSGSYQVMVVRPRGEFTPCCWRDLPREFDVLFVPVLRVRRWAAMSWARAFNRRELRCRCGVGAVVQPAAGVHFCLQGRCARAAPARVAGLASRGVVQFD